MNWVRSGPASYALSSGVIFAYRDPYHLFGCQTCGGQLNYGGEYLTCHELGHSLGNLPHRTDMPESCMEALGSYAPNHLTDAEKQRIINLLPGTVSTAQHGKHHEHTHSKQTHHSRHHRYAGGIPADVPYPITN
jgi:hypothetical protein